MRHMRGVLRRDFVRGAAAAALGAPLVVPSSAWGANDRITAGIIGLGGPAGGGGAGTELLAVCDVRGDKLQRYKDRKDVTIYRDGEKYAQYTMKSAPQVFGPESIVMIGKRHIDTGDNRCFAGTIDDARVYDIALDAATIAALRPSQAADQLTGPKPWAWWTFEDGRATDLMGAFDSTLLIGGAGIASVMFANVAERKRELGTMMALGATPSMVSRMILLKASAVGVAGGICGLVFGLVAAYVAGPQFLGVDTSVSINAMMIGMIVAVMVALAASYPPARKAAHLDPCLCFQDA